MVVAAAPIPVGGGGRWSSHRLGPEVTGEGVEALAWLFWTKAARRKDLPRGDGDNVLTIVEEE
jgi:hypothetical protein